MCAVSQAIFFARKYKKQIEAEREERFSAELRERLLDDQLKQIQASWHITWKDILLLNEIGRGANGVVTRAQWLGNTVAVKRVVASRLVVNTESEAFQREADIMASLRHPNLVTFYGAGKTNDG